MLNIESVHLTDISSLLCLKYRVVIGVSAQESARDDGVFRRFQCFVTTQSTSADDKQADDFCIWSPDDGVNGALGEQSVHCITEPIF